MSETTKVDPIDEAAARALGVSLPVRPHAQVLAHAARACRLAILRGMLERGPMQSQRFHTRMLAASGMSDERTCQDFWHGMLSAEIDSLDPGREDS